MFPDSVTFNAAAVTANKDTTLVKDATKDLLPQDSLDMVRCYKVF